MTGRPPAEARPVVSSGASADLFDAPPFAVAVVGPRPGKSCRPAQGGGL